MAKVKCDECHSLLMSTIDSKVLCLDCWNDLQYELSKSTEDIAKDKERQKKLDQMASIIHQK